MSMALHPFDAKRYGPLPPQQQRVLDFIKSKKRFPSAAAIADHMGWMSDASAYDCLCRLEWRGSVTRRNSRWELADETMIGRLDPQAQREPLLNQSSEPK